MATKPAKKAAPVKKATGRPSRYKPEFAEQAKKLCKLGMIDKELAEFFGVSEQTLNAWKKAHPEFLESLKGGKALADAEVAAKLFHRATGYEHPDSDIKVINNKVVITPMVKHYPPDTTAAIFWLKNRQPKKWRDKPEADSDDDVPVLPVKVVVQVKDARADDADA